MLEIAKPTVKLLACPVATGGILDFMVLDGASTNAEYIMEFAGRSCYQSFNKPNPATADNRDYLANILRQGHESVLEHASFVFYITGVSRALTHELIRHRHLSYSQLSQRFVDERQARIVLPPAIEAGSIEHAYLEMSAESSLAHYQAIVDLLSVEDHELSRKQVREAARAVLPNCIETRIVVSGNVRAWRDMLKKRLDPSADAEIRLVSQMIFDELKLHVPNALQDFEEGFWDVNAS